jgi:spore germination protein YaaH
MRQYLCCYLAIALVFLTSCASSQAPQEPTTQLKSVTLDNKVKIVRGQTVYVPVYSHIYYVDRDRRREFATTLSIRNTDLTNPIIIASASYYNTNGELVRKYLDRPVELKPLAATDFIVNLNDTSGGNKFSDREVIKRKSADRAD